MLLVIPWLPMLIRTDFFIIGVELIVVPASVGGGCADG
jgi:hypothetical protein